MLYSSLNNEESAITINIERMLLLLKSKFRLDSEKMQNTEKIKQLNFVINKLILEKEEQEDTIVKLEKELSEIRIQFSKAVPEGDKILSSFVYFVINIRKKQNLTRQLCRRMQMNLILKGLQKQMLI